MKNLLVIDLSSVLAGPATGQFFAELGARVIKVENKTRGGDPTRFWKCAEEDPKKETSYYFDSVNWKKEMLFLDLTVLREREELYQLIDQADIVISNYQRRVAKKLKVDPFTLKTLNPRLIYGEITAYGVEDPRGGYDALLQAELGMMEMNGEREGSPCKLPFAVIDMAASYQLRAGILYALYQRERDGKGRHVQVNLFQSGLSLMTNQVTNTLGLHRSPERMGSEHPNLYPYGAVFSTQTEPLIFVIGSDFQFIQLCALLKRSDISEDPRFETNQKRCQNRGELRQILQDILQSRKAQEVVKSCLSKGVPAGTLHPLQDSLSHPLAKEIIHHEGERFFLAQNTFEVDSF